ncbi:hypothetical protein [Granulicella aggregans]|uniref:hypothetical protein n=1 Tax=Granulicella aggregans TaxID=474949 RepID=UPI0021E04CFB|nr:hypothetical protein [Granulicella aggregans]
MPNEKTQRGTLKPQRWLTVAKSDEIYGGLVREIAAHKRNIALLEVKIRQAGSDIRSTGESVLNFDPSIEWDAVAAAVDEMRVVMPELHTEQATLADKQTALEAMDA